MSKKLKETQKYVRYHAKRIKDLHSIQGADGNWDFDPYMYGLYNGIEMCLSIVEDREPEFKDAPKKWRSKEAEAIKRKGDLCVSI
jgi:hypothetical protein